LFIKKRDYGKEFREKIGRSQQGSGNSYFRHGMWASSEYNAWSAMLKRCRKPNTRSYDDYGARGIKVCERWLDFKNFMADMGQKLTAQHSLDREDNDGDYSPDNCRWATAKEQANNRRTCRLLTVNGVTKNVTQWAEYLGLNRHTVFDRLRYHPEWSPERVLGLNQ